MTTKLEGGVGPLFCVFPKLTLSLTALTHIS